MFLPFTYFLYRFRKSQISVLESELARAWIPTVPKGPCKHWSLVCSIIRRWWKSRLVGNYVPGKWYGSIAGTLGSPLSAIKRYRCTFSISFYLDSLSRCMHKCTWVWTGTFAFFMSQAFCYSILSDTETYFLYNKQNKKCITQMKLFHLKKIRIAWKFLPTKLGM